MVYPLRVLFSCRHLVRSAVVLVLYAGLVYCLSVVLMVLPVQAFVSSTGYVRVATEASRLVYMGANRAALLSTVASSVAAPSAASVAIRLVAGPVGWAALGVTAGLALAQMYYSAQDVASLRQAAGTNTTTVTNPQGQVVVLPVAAHPTIVFGTPPSAFCGSYVYFGPTTFAGISYLQSIGFNTTTGWNGAGSGEGNQFLCKTVGSTPSVTQTSSPPDQQKAEQYLTGLPASDPLSIESHEDPVGVGGTPISAVTEQSVPVSPTQIPTVIKPVGQVSPTDTVVDPNAQPNERQDTAGQGTERNTKTTTNPDGSTTETETETATVSCGVGDHDHRSFGQVLQDHMALWAGSGPAGQLNLLKSLVWPSTLPVIPLTSTIFGSGFSIDMNQWAGWFAVLRTIVIAGAGFAAYRIIFVGGA